MYRTNFEKFKKNNKIQKQEIIGDFKTKGIEIGMLGVLKQI